MEKVFLWSSYLLSSTVMMQKSSKSLTYIFFFECSLCSLTFIFAILIFFYFWAYLENLPPLFGLILDLGQLLSGQKQVWWKKSSKFLSLWSGQLSTFVLIRTRQTKESATELRQQKKLSLDLGWIAAFASCW